MRPIPTLLALLLTTILAVRADEADTPHVLPLDTNALATLAVQDHGRKKPFTTFAQEMLLSLSGHSPLELLDATGVPVKDAEGNALVLAPEQVILDLWFKPEGWDDRPLILLNFLDLKKKLGLAEDRKLFAFNELIKNQPLLDLLDEAQKQRQAGKGDDLPAVQKEAEHLGERLRLFQDLVNGRKEAVVPNRLAAEATWAPIQDVASVGDWPAEKAPDGAPSYDVSPAGDKFMAWYRAYRGGDVDAFNALTPQVVEALKKLAPEFYPPAHNLQFEHRYMVIDPFLWAWVIYFVALLVLLLTSIWFRSVGYKLTWILVVAGLALELYGFAARTIISHRPPVTDLYETVIWVSFIGMVFAVILEAVYRKRYLFYAGLPAAILTLIVADSDSTILDASINPLTAVLRDNMWLTIHVLTIVSSYAAFALTAALGHLALTMSFWGKRYAAAQSDVQYFIYRAMQIGILLLATGTILGGVWANYSWGRFWGWDPKETWALITLLCYLALLHGRLAGWWKGFGLAIGSIVCFLSVMMSWYGVNFILGQNGKSLHSYGLSTGGLGYAGGFAGFELAFVAVVLVWHRRQAAAGPMESQGSLRPPSKGLVGEGT